MPLVCIPLLDSVAGGDKTYWIIKKHNMAPTNRNKTLRDTDQDSDTDSDNETLLSLVCVSMLQMVLVLLTSLNCYMSTLRLVHYALLLTSACWKSSNTDAWRLMAFVLSLASDPTLGIHSHNTLDTAQPCHLLKPYWKPSSSHSISAPTNINTQFLQQCVWVWVFPHALCKLF